MLHNLGAEDTVEGGLRLIGEVREQVRNVGFESFVAAGGDGLRGEIDAARGDLRVVHHLQKLAAAATDVQHAAAAREIRQVDLCPALTYSSVPRKRSAKRA